MEKEQAGCHRRTAMVKARSEKVFWRNGEIGGKTAIQFSGSPRFKGLIETRTGKGRIRETSAAGDGGVVPVKSPGASRSSPPAGRAPARPLPGSGRRRG